MYLFVLYFLLFTGSTKCEHLLVVPFDGSHWISTRPLIERLGQKGHNITVLMPEANLRMEESQHYTSRLFPVPFSKMDLDMIQKSLSSSIFSQQPLTEKIMQKLERFWNISRIMLSTCESLLFNRSLIQYLKREGFHAVLVDPLQPCGAIVAEYLSVPAVNVLYGIPCGLDVWATQCPNPPSYVPSLMTTYSDYMTFSQRLKNLLVRTVEVIFCNVLYSPYSKLATEFLGQDVTILEVLSHASVWLMKFDFLLQFPRPLMPNMILIGGINCNQPKTISQEFEEYVNKSGDHGIVVFSLGSMVSELPMEVTMQFADAFGKIPQTVLWRYTGPEPPNLSENTKLVKWLPQNDLLAHSKTRVFITHGGTHGLYEAICSGVPMIMMPLFGDQASNVKRMERHGVGVILNLPDLTSQKLLEALETVINDTRYKERMTELSAIHKDRPIEPLDLAVHWIEFVMRHKGADHLRPAAHDLNWIQYHSLDVIAFLAAVTLVTTFIGFKCCLFCCRKLFCRRHQRKSKSE
ncbi:UDP-glucuronosyltransferase 1A1-like isoform X2 [Protopterus annectens]|uniref:UDP-glucuronosyltransferase 1A1-like isoform X2 n=1 Tax=Protopterus annectens TaxID=7888 RepID=UPI001CF9A56E|nr:UDP-glucuronosyltransferase 1A1-like isoform X2 [Protopterus annectens]